ncbi:MAG TPA: CBS domain-containing protein [Tepidiformaceae bacterium]|nr:CBS domain-containing protein [Thermoflexaceae bacterium]HMS59068.1 CBS domain-containing protein [Tepidiformaceae bacterium]
MKLENVLAVKGSRIETCALTDTVRDVIAHLKAANVGALVVVDGGRPVGIISERDIARAVDGESNVPSLPVQSLMTREVVFGAPGDDVAAVLDTMTANHFRHLPVVLDGELVGIVTTGDLVRAELDTLRGHVVTLEDQVMAGGGE